MLSQGMVKQAKHVDNNTWLIGVGSNQSRLYLPTVTKSCSQIARKTLLSGPALSEVSWSHGSRAFHAVNRHHCCRTCLRIPWPQHGVQDRPELPPTVSHVSHGRICAHMYRREALLAVHLS